MTTGLQSRLDEKRGSRQGLLGGLSFALLYMTLGVPIARLAERHNRVRIVSISIAVWSVMTALCGLAGSYTQLLLFRIGVGVGEAGAAPPSLSIIADYFPPKQRASAISTHSFGIALGGLLGASIGGFVAEHYGWRAAFLIVGLPGILLALLILYTLREPMRGMSDPPAALAAASAPPPSLRAAAARMFRQQTFVHIVIGASIANFAIQGIHQFDVAYFLRRFDMGLGEAGFYIGVVGGAATGAGMLLGGWITDHFGRFDPRWYAWAPAMGLVLAVPVYFAGFLLPEEGFAIVPRRRNGCSAVRFPCTAPRDHLEPRHGPHASDGGGVADAGDGGDRSGPRSDADRHAQRPAHCARVRQPLRPSVRGRLHPGPAPGEVADMCRAASATGVQHALLACSCLFVWAAAHFVLAARTLRTDMQAAGMLSAPPGGPG